MYVQKSKNQQPNISPNTLNQLLSKHWKEANQLHSLGYHNSQQSTAMIATKKIRLCSQFADILLKYYLQVNMINGDNSNSEKQKTVIDNIYNQLTKQWKFGQVAADYLLGFSMLNQIMSGDVFGSLINRIDDIVKQQKKESKNNGTKLEFDLSESSDQDFPNFYDFNKKKIQESPSSKQGILNTDNNQDHTMNSSTKISYSDMLNDSDFFTENDITLQLSPEEEEINSELIMNENQAIRQYLYKLSKATTELSYLCQHMKWSQPTSTDKKSQINQALYSSVVEVVVRIKDKAFVISGNCTGAISKKQARRIASLFVLRKIYNKFPEVWQKFKILCEINQGIQQPLNANNQQIFKKANLDVLDVSFFKEQKKSLRNDDPISIKITQYLDSLPSYKNQINLLIGRYKQISPPHMHREKQDQMALWPVNASIYDGTQVLKSQAKEISKKKAEQKCCRQLLEMLYHKNFNRFKSFVDYKKMKNL